MSVIKHSKSEKEIYGLLAEFEDPETLIEAAHKVYGQGYRKIDAYSPFPIEELSEAVGHHHSWLPLIVLLGGLFGCIGGFAMQYYASVISYPVIIGGRPFNSWPQFMPITFETTILCAAGAAVLGMLALNGLPMPYHPLFNIDDFSDASSDRFFLCIKARDKRFDLKRTRKFLDQLAPKQVHEVEL